MKNDKLKSLLARYIANSNEMSLLDTEISKKTSKKEALAKDCNSIKDEILVGDQLKFPFTATIDDTEYLFTSPKFGTINYAPILEIATIDEDSKDEATS